MYWQHKRSCSSTSWHLSGPTTPTQMLKGLNIMASLWRLQSTTNLSEVEAALRPHTVLVLARVHELCPDPNSVRVERCVQVFRSHCHKCARTLTMQEFMVFGGFRSKSRQEAGGGRWLCGATSVDDEGGAVSDVRTVLRRSFPEARLLR